MAGALWWWCGVVVVWCGGGGGGGVVVVNKKTPADYGGGLCWGVGRYYLSNLLTAVGFFSLCIASSFSRCLGVVFFSAYLLLM